MSIVTKEGFGALRFAYLVFVVGLGVAVFLATSSYLYWQLEKKNNVQSQRTLGDVQSRSANAKRERDDLRNSEDTYKALTARGVFITEKRLDLLEAMEALKIRHNIVTLEYEMSPQRPLKLASGTTLTAIDALGSRIKLKASALHDGDMVAFLAEFPRMQRGLFPIDRCVLKRTNVASSVAAIPTAPTTQTTSPQQVASLLAQLSGSGNGGGNANNNTDDDEANANTAAVISKKITPTLEAECSLEWITLLDKRTTAAEVAAASATGALR
jgi:hypothetical protein